MAPPCSAAFSLWSSADSMRRHGAIRCASADDIVAHRDSEMVIQASDGSRLAVLIPRGGGRSTGMHCTAKMPTHGPDQRLTQNGHRSMSRVAWVRPFAASPES